MRPFDFVITFFSFIFTLALTHMLLAVTHMIRHRREVVLDLPHSLWMLNALGFLAANWISLWDFHGLTTLSLTTIALGFFYCINQYFVCALASPRLEEDGFNMHLFHERQSVTYIGAFALLVVFSIAINYFAGSGLNVQNWARENGVVIAMLPVVVTPLVSRARWVQIAAPAILLVLIVIYMITFYPALR